MPYKYDECFQPPDQLLKWWSILDLSSTFFITSQSLSPDLLFHLHVNRLTSKFRFGLCRNYPDQLPPLTLPLPPPYMSQASDGVIMVDLTHQSPLNTLLQPQINFLSSSIAVQWLTWLGGRLLNGINWWHSQSDSLRVKSNLPPVQSPQLIKDSGGLSLYNNHCSHFYNRQPLKKSTATGP